jgi:hypothetical protein
LSGVDEHQKLKSSIAAADKNCMLIFQIGLLCASDLHDAERQQAK